MDKTKFLGIVAESHPEIFGESLKRIATLGHKVLTDATKTTKPTREEQDEVNDLFDNALVGEIIGHLVDAGQVKVQA